MPLSFSEPIDCAWPDSFEERYALHYKPSTAHAFRFTRNWTDAEISAQLSFVDLSANHHWDRPFFYRVVRNKAISSFRKTVREREIVITGAGLDGGEGGGQREQELEKLADPKAILPSDAAASKDLANLVGRMRASLHPKDLAVFDLAQETSQAEAASQLNMSENAFKMRWRAIRLRLRERFEREGGELGFI